MMRMILLINMLWVIVPISYHMPRQGVRSRLRCVDHVTGPWRAWPLLDHDISLGFCLTLSLERKHALVIICIPYPCPPQHTGIRRFQILMAPHHCVVVYRFSSRPG